jgi:hypothetical protein
MTTEHLLLALARLQLGDVEEYRKLCTDTLGQFGPQAKTDSAHWAVWTCVLAADAVTDWKVPLHLAERDVAANPKNRIRPANAPCMPC